MRITDRNGNAISGNYFSITSDDSDGFEVNIDHVLDSTSIAKAIAEYVNKYYNNDSIVYKNRESK